MRKVFNTICTILLAASAFSACKEVEPVWTEPAKTMSIESANLVFGPNPGSSDFTVKAENSFTASADRDWCTVSVSGSTVTVTVTENPSNETRYARVNLVSGAEKLGITVHQGGIIIKGFSTSDQVVSYRPQTITFNYETNGTLNVTTDAPWITVEVTPTTVVLNVARNEEGTTREGVVNWTLGETSGSFLVSQNPEFKVQEGWTTAYNGKEMFRTTMYDMYSCKVAEEVKGKPYTYHIVSKSTFNSYGISMAEYVDNYGWKKALKELQNTVDSYQGQYTITDFLFTDSSDNYYLSSEYPAGEYYILAIGLSAEGKPSGEFAATLVNTAPPAYSYWLGDWEVLDDQKQKFALSFTKGATDTSYTVTGLRGYDWPLTAAYNKNGTVTLIGSSTKSIISEPFTYSTYVFSAMYLQGSATNGSATYTFTGSTLNIAMFSKADDDHALLNGLWLTYSSDWYQYVRINLRGPASNNGAAAANTTLVSAYMPATMTKVK